MQRIVRFLVIFIVDLPEKGTGVKRDTRVTETPSEKEIKSKEKEVVYLDLGFELQDSLHCTVLKPLGLSGQPS